MAETNGMNLKVFFLVIMGVLIGIPLLISIADSSANLVDTYSITNDTITTGITTGTTPSLDHKNLSSFLTIYNVTGEDVTTFCNKTLATGSLSCNKTGSTTAYASYSFRSADYIDNGIVQTLVKLLPLFFALALVAIGLWYVYNSYLKELF